LLGLLAEETYQSNARELADAIAKLGLVAADLDRSANWPWRPTETLLAAARKNSALSAWLTVWRTLFGCPEQNGAGYHIHLPQ
jgi:hypothetical protein